jgi:Skp family chaperone for outer membrane proteins
MKLNPFAAPLAIVPLLAGLWFAGDRTAHAQGGPNAVRAVDIDTIAQSSTQAKAIMSDFQKFQKSKQDELQKEQEVLQKEQQKLTANSSKDELAAYSNKVQNISRKLQDAEVEAQKRFQSSREQIVKALRPALEGFAKENGIGMIVDSKSGAVLYLDPSWDRTKDIVARLKK